MRCRTWFWILLVLGAAVAACRSDARGLREVAEDSWRSGDYEKAIRLNRELIARDPKGKDAAQALLNIGTICYRNLRKIRSAVDTLNRIVEEFPGEAEEYQARLLLAEIYANEVNDVTQAIAEYEKLLSWSKLENRAEIQFRLADACFKKEDFDRALRELQHIEESGISGHLADQVSLKTGSIYQIQRRYEDALAQFQRAAQSTCVECRRRAILNLAETYESLFDFDKAIETVRKLDPSPENEIRIRQEVARIEARQTRMNAAGGRIERDRRQSKK